MEPGRVTPPSDQIAREALGIENRNPPGRPLADPARAEMRQLFLRSCAGDRKAQRLFSEKVARETVQALLDLGVDVKPLARFGRKPKRSAAAPTPPRPDRESGGRELQWRVAAGHCSGPPPPALKRLRRPLLETGAPGSAQRAMSFTATSRKYSRSQRDTRCVAEAGLSALLAPEIPGLRPCPGHSPVSPAVEAFRSPTPFADRPRARAPPFATPKTKKPRRTLGQRGRFQPSSEG